MTFDEWLDEIENFATRRERLNEDVDFAAVMCGNLSHNLARRRMYEWLEAAYNVGYAANNGEAKIAEIEKKLDQIIALLSTSKPYQPPTYPTYPTYPKPSWPGESQTNKCIKCGLTLTGVMGYVCNDSQCPTFARVTCVSFGTKSTEGYNG
jgi:hypothetical protein